GRRQAAGHRGAVARGRCRAVALAAGTCRPRERGSAAVVTAGEARAEAPDDTRLRLTLERLWQESRGCRIKAAGLRRRASPFATLFPAEVVSLVLETGEEVSFFVKHLGPEQADHPEKQCRDREPRAYAELLGGEGLPVPRYYGSRWNEATKRREVF